VSSEIQDRMAAHCIYTIRHSDLIQKFSKSAGPFSIDTKSKSWTSGKQLIADARRESRVPTLLFAPAEDTTNVVAYGELISIETGRRNQCTFKNVRYLPRPLRKSQLIKRNGERIAQDFIRDYAICRTPALNLIIKGKVGAFAHTVKASSQVIPDCFQRRRAAPLLKQIAHSIRVANEADSAKWGVRVNQAGLMLKVGFVEVLQAGDGWFHFLVERNLVPREFKTNRSVSLDWKFSYKNAPGCICCDLSASAATGAYRTLKRAHEAAIRVASRSPRHTTTAKDHSPEFVEFLCEQLDVQLPQPSYYGDGVSDRPYNEGGPSSSRLFEEGAVDQVLVSRYERDPYARAACIRHYGPICAACDATLENLYGPEASGLIHVHHVQPLASVGKSRKTDPVRDLRPVCPNCHAVIHSINPPRSIDQVRRMFRGRSES
jgi:hypothetical protein